MKWSYREQKCGKSSSSYLFFWRTHLQVWYCQLFDRLYASMQAIESGRRQRRCTLWNAVTMPLFDPTWSTAWRYYYHIAAKRHNHVRGVFDSYFDDKSNIRCLFIYGVVTGSQHIIGWLVGLFAVTVCVQIRSTFISSRDKTAVLKFKKKVHLKLHRTTTHLTPT